MPQVFRRSTLRDGRFQVKLFGDWDKTIRVLNRLSPEIKKGSIKAQTRICEEIKNRVRGHLISQDLNWASLSSKYLKRKEKKNLDTRTLIAWGEYYHAITTWTIGSQHLTMVGVKTGIYTKKLNGKRNPLEVAKIAALHELSNGNKIPRRPLWNPTIAEMGGAKGLKTLYNTHLKNILRRAGIPVKDFRKKLF